MFQTLIDLMTKEDLAGSPIVCISISAWSMVKLSHKRALSFRTGFNYKKVIKTRMSLPYLLFISLSYLDIYSM